MLDDPKVLPKWFTVSSRSLGGDTSSRLRTPDQGVRLDSQGAVEEGFVIDDRSSLSAAQVVENKLTRLLKDASLPVSHLQTRNLLRSR